MGNGEGMFALEIGFKGESPATETLFIRRPTALIGAGGAAHVIVDDMSPLGFGIMVSRQVGRTFRISPVPDAPGVQTPQYLQGVYDGEALIDLGPLSLRVTALDNDLTPKESEAPDKAGVRILRQACAVEGPQFPAVLLVSDPPAMISFIPGQPLLVGRSRQCTLRIDVPSISSRHARIGFESGQFWIEDLGSTNGTFVNNQQISGRTDVAPGVPIALGRNVTLVGVLTAEDASGALESPTPSAVKPSLHEKRYPLLLSLSETARPAQLMLTPGSSVVLGRDPSSDMWLGVPHVSRRHCSVDVSPTGSVRITDSSTNGTAFDRGVLRQHESTETANRPLVLDFGGGVTVGLCFSPSDEEEFVSSKGDVKTFVGIPAPSTEQDSHSGGKKVRRRKSTSFLRPPEELRRSALALSTSGHLTQLFLRLSLKGKLVIVGVVMALLGVASVVVGSLLSGFKV